MAAVALSTFRTLVRERADMVGSTFIADSATGIDQFINEGAQKLHQILVEAYSSDYMEKQYGGTVSSGILNLPADFFKLLGVEIDLNGQRHTLRRFNRQERNAHSNASPYSSLPLYKLTGVSTNGTRRMEFLPAALANGKTVYIRYAPALTARNSMGADTGTVLVSTTDTLEFDNGWERYIVLYAAIQMLKKEESDTRDLERELDKCELEIKAGAETRDADQPPSAVDADLADLDPLWYI